MSSDMRQKVVGYLLGELTPDEKERFEAGLLTDPGLRVEVERLRPVVGSLEGHGKDAWVPLEPPPLDIALIVGGAEASGASGHAEAAADNPSGTLPGTSSAAAPALGGDSPGRNRRSLAELLGFAWPRVAVGALSALLLLAVGVGVGLQLGGDGSVQGEDAVRTVQLEAIGQEAPPDASGEVLMTSGGGATGDQMTLDVSGLEQSGEREFYELWLLGEKGELIALGSFRVPPGGSSTIEVPVPVDPDSYRYFDLSIQSENGDPQHSGRSVLRGLTSS